VKDKYKRRGAPIEEIVRKLGLEPTGGGEERKEGADRRVGIGGAGGLGLVPMASAEGGG